MHAWFPGERASMCHGSLEACFLSQSHSRDISPGSLLCLLSCSSTQWFAALGRDSVNQWVTSLGTQVSYISVYKEQREDAQVVSCQTGKITEPHTSSDSLASPLRGCGSREPLSLLFLLTLTQICLSEEVQAAQYSLHSANWQRTTPSSSYQGNLRWRRDPGMQITSV